MPSNLAVPVEKKKRRIVTESIGKRKSLRDRDRDRCRYCGDPYDNVDHVKPKSKGGGENLGNLVLACYECNIYKKDELAFDKGMSLLPPGTVNIPVVAAFIRARCRRLVSLPPYRRLMEMEVIVSEAMIPATFYSRFVERPPTDKRKYTEGRRLRSRAEALLRQQADEAAANPHNLHYPYVRALGDGRPTKRGQP